MARQKQAGNRRAKDAAVSSSTVGVTASRLATPVDPSSSIAGSTSTMGDGGPRPLLIDMKLFAWLGGLTLVGVAVYLLRDLLTVLLFVGAVTFIGAPIVDVIARRGYPRAVGAACFLGGVGVILAALVSLVLPTLVDEVSRLAAALPDALTRALASLSRLTGQRVPTRISELTDGAARELIAKLAPLAEKGGVLLRLGAAGVVSSAASFVSVLLQACLVPVLAFFVLVELPDCRRVLVALSPRAWRRALALYGPAVDVALSGLFRAQLVVASMLAGMYVVALWCVGVPLAPAIGVLTGAAYLVPFASPLVCIVLSVVFSLLELEREAWAPIGGALITCAVLQLVESYVLTPRIVGEKAGLSPLAAMLAVVVGGNVAGFLGVLFALPAAAAIAVVLRERTRAVDRRTPSLSSTLSTGAEA